MDRQAKRNLGMLAILPAGVVIAMLLAARSAYNGASGERIIRRKLDTYSYLYTLGCMFILLGLLLMVSYGQGSRLFLAYIVVFAAYIVSTVFLQVSLYKVKLSLT
jgi:cobalamin synthase